MKILQINAVAQFGSTGCICQELKEYINKIPGYSCYIAFSNGYPDKGDIMLGSRFENKLHALLSRLTGLQGYFSYHSTKKLIRHLESEKPDLVILHNLHANYIHLPALLNCLAKNDIPTLLVLHDCWFYTGKCCHYTRIGCYKWKSGCGNCPKLHCDNKSWFADRTAKMWADKKRLFAAIPRLAVVGVSDWITQEAKQSFLSCARHTARIYNWINLEVFQAKRNRANIKQQLGIISKKMILGVASWWNDNKGLNHFVTLANELGTDYAVVLVGNRPALSSQPGNLYFPGSIVSNDELADYYSAADVFVTMSIEESFGKVSAEALACGTPIVCFASTANKELVGDGCGEVVDLGDMQAMKLAIRRICAQDKELISPRCRQYVEANFAKDARMQDYLRIIRSLVGKDDR